MALLWAVSSPCATAAAGSPARPADPAADHVVQAESAEVKPSLPPPLRSTTEKNAAASARVKAKRLALWMQAERALEEEQPHLALQAFRQVFELEPGFDAAAALADVARQMGRFDEAAYYFNYAAAHLPVTQHEAYWERLQQDLQTVRQRVAELELEVLPRNATVLVENHPAKKPLYVAPGWRQLTVKAPGYETQQLELKFEAGSTVVRSVRLMPVNAVWGNGAEEAPSPGDPQAERAPKAAREVRRPWVLWTGGSLTAALGLGALGLVWDLRSRTAVDADADPSECYGRGNLPECQSLAQADRTARQEQAWARGLAVGAGLSAVTTGVLYWLWKRPLPLSARVSSTEGELRWTYSF